MKIHIEDSSTTKSLKEQFSKVYPFLKLEFFTKGHEKGEGSEKEHLISLEKPLSEIRTKHNKVDFHITPETKVSEVEQGFEINFGVHVQVYRKSGSLWLETTSTDSWTLQEQNEVGMDMEA